jgi:hypothetical protein
MEKEVKKCLYESLLNEDLDANDNIADEIPVMKEWEKKVKAFRNMYSSAAMFYAFVTALIDIPLIILPIVCSTFNINMQTNAFKSTEFYVLNGCIALIPILHGMQKYFAFSETLASLKRARAAFDEMSYEIQIFMVQMKHIKEADVVEFMDSIEQRIVSSNEIEHVPFWIRRRYDPDTSGSVG